MRSKITPRRIIPIVTIVVLALLGWAYYSQQSAASGGASTFSGTIEATEVNVPTLAGGRVEQVYVAEGDPVRKGEQLVLIASAGAASTSENVTFPIDGVVLERLVEPAEFAPTGSTVMVVAALDALALKIYVPEDQYGRISLGQVFPVAVDSFPGETFSGKVSFISDQAEFTPRNVQTKYSRQTTVYAVKLGLAPSAGKLKPGMPADATVP